MKSEVYIALGVGLILGALLMSMSSTLALNLNIEERARDLGMVYPEEVRVNLNEGENEE